MERRREREDNLARKAAMSAFAAASGDELRELAKASGLVLDATPLRGPETGLVTVRGRIGGGGAPFNTGEATVTRATVQLPSGQVGHAYALGRDREKVRLAAVLDAAWCTPETRAAVEQKIVAPLVRMQAERDAKRHAETAATKVDFFTMVRGED
ncbi:phosphonate C-P lyase system protein PhnG [Mesorhizobium sp. VNQ89]|uniref:phosphonate C-P lyase system protein PhnG n=1 Tax=Mesorhizobium quangtriensis TaxID=3157709 RepID=UPI0032B72E8C